MSTPPSDYQIPVHQIDATKKRVHPRFVTGFYQNIRVVSMYFLLGLFLILPWIRYGGHQAVWFDFPDSRIVLFGATFLPPRCVCVCFFLYGGGVFAVYGDGVCWSGLVNWLCLSTNNLNAFVPACGKMGGR